MGLILGRFILIDIEYALMRLIESQTWRSCVHERVQEGIRQGSHHYVRFRGHELAEAWHY